MNPVAKATRVEPGNAGGTAAVRCNNDRAGVASRLLAGGRQPGRARWRSPEVSVSGVASLHLSTSLNFGRLPARTGAGLFRDGVSPTASRQSDSLRRAGTSRRVSVSVLAGEAARGRALRFVVARPLVQFSRHCVNSVVRVRLVAETDTIRRTARDVAKIWEKFRVRSTGAGSERVCV